MEKKNLLKSSYYRVLYFDSIGLFDISFGFSTKEKAKEYAINYCGEHQNISSFKIKHYVEQI